MNPAENPKAEKRPDGDVLIVSPEDLLESGLQRRLAAVVTGAFLLLCGGAGLLDLVRPAERPMVSGPEMAALNRKRSRARIRDGSQMTIWSQDLNDRSNIRAALVPWYLVWMIEYLREGSDEALVGPDGWIYLWSRVQPWSSARYGRHAVDNDPRLPELAARVLRSVDRRLVSLGLDGLLMPLPRKAVLSAEHLPEEIDPFAEFDHRVLERLTEWGVPHVDLFDAFEGWPVEQLWHAQDAHWTQRAQSLAAEAVGESWRIGPPVEERAAVESEQPARRRRHDSLVTLGMTRNHPAVEHIRTNEVSDLVLFKRDPDRPEGHGPEARMPAPPDEPQWALVGTSFSSGDYLRHFLTNNLGTAPLDHSRQGVDTLETLGSRLADPGDLGPNRWLIEVPMYQLFFADGRTGGLMIGAGVRTFHRATSYVPHSTLHELDAREYSSRGPIQIEAGELIHDGDGAVQLVLEAETGPNRHLTLKVRQGSVFLLGQWKKGEKRASVTLFSEGRSEEPLVVRLSPRRNFGSVRVRAVTEYDLERGVGTTPSTPSASTVGDGWTQDFLFPEARSIDRHHSLVLRTAGSYSGRLGVELIAASPSDGARQLGDLQILQNAVALISAGGPGGPFRGIRIRGEGSPGAGQVEVSLVTLREPSR